MPTITSTGIGSGLDVKNIVSQLVELEKRPLSSIQLRTAAAQARLSVVGQIKGQLAALDDSLRALTLGSTYNAMTVKSSSQAVAGSAAFTATPASYNVQVQQLARGQVAQSAVISGGPIGSGTLTIEMGAWQSGPTFQSAGSPITVTVNATDTLSDIANKINQATTSVRAVVLNDGGGQRLVIRSTGTGENQGFRIQVSDNDGNDTDNLGLSRLAYDPENSTAGLTLTQSAQNTVALIDGVSVTSSDRTIANAIPGVTLTVSEVTSQPVTVEVKQDQDSVKKALQAFVDAYNKLNSTLSDALKYDAKSGQAGPLQGDSAVVALQSALRRMIFTDNPANPTMRTWSDIGVEMQRDGSLKINESKLSAALNNPSDLQNMLAGTNGPTQGLARQFRDFTTGALASDGRVNSKVKAIENEIGRLNDQAKRINEKASRTEERLLEQYSRLDRNLARLNSLGQYVGQQIAQWNKTPSR
ncbi:Flagellar hook-associated protein 2 [Tepidimonas alkaliphilus]|uniref:Flagellar hook-associated protein 2 n=1 Tax=Tepidimonas alkaliphilus TaxID=2588942 RepID=A0A554W3L5_9BURK|nr:flagellar filament capping protein FliD [Tepidimonas alkaliphilus]TSE18159.1 Flagellar hook-associated protein 2 [Tepidimonas alkaliphilus]